LDDDAQAEDAGSPARAGDLELEPSAMSLPSDLGTPRGDDTTETAVERARTSQPVTNSDMPGSPGQGSPFRDSARRPGSRVVNTEAWSPNTSIAKKSESLLQASMLQATERAQFQEEMDRLAAEEAAEERRLQRQHDQMQAQALEEDHEEELDMSHGKKKGRKSKKEKADGSAVKKKKKAQASRGLLSLAPAHAVLRQNRVAEAGGHYRKRSAKECTSTAECMRSSAVTDSLIPGAALFLNFKERGGALY
ncbi:hypothetical protein CYMTET_40739, partial [Cymbomonas tetramitiformis]